MMMMIKKIHCPKCNYRQEVQPAVITIATVFNYTGAINTNCPKCKKNYKVKLNSTPNEKR